MARASARGAKVLAAAVLALALGLAGCARPQTRVAPVVPARAVSPAAPLPRPAPPAPPPTLSGRPPRPSQLIASAHAANLVIVVLDAARADRVGCYGYPRPTTPVVDELARESVLFRNHFAPSSATKTSTASLFTGLYPDTHLVLSRGSLAAGTFTLAGALRARGWRTALFSSNVNTTPQVGLRAGFAEVYSPPRGKVAGIESEEQTPEALTRAFAHWTKLHHRDRLFAYVHLLPPHIPYRAPASVRAPFLTSKPAFVAVPHGYAFPQLMGPGWKPRRYSSEEWANLYDANLRWADWGVGEVVRALQERGLLDRTLLVVTSDHGEAFGEHGYLYHMRGVYDELVHIPLLVRFPGRRRPVGAVEGLTQTSDVLPTLCDLYGVRYPRGEVQGTSLLPLITGTREAVHTHAFSTSQGDWPSYLVRSREWSLILYPAPGMRALYDLRRDPGQLHNVYAAHPEEAERLLSALRTFARTQRASLDAYLSPGAARAPRAAKQELSERTRRELKALGYVD